jgi:hypothetical protein
MPLDGDFNGLRKLERSIADLSKTGGASQAQVARGVISEVRGLLREQFTSGIGPDGSPLTPTVRGRPALVSRKLPQAFTGSPIPGGAAMSLRVEWLEAHQHGHTFPSRQAAGQTMIFRKGKLVSQARAAKGWQGPKSWQDVRSRAHTVGQRVLPARAIVPEGALPPRWAQAVGQGATNGMQAWYERAAK